MKRKRILIVLLELVLLIVVVGGVYFFTQSQIEPTQVFVFSTPMEAGQVISKSNLSVTKIPAKAVNNSFLRTQESVIGKVVTADITPGQYVVRDLVTDKEKLNPLVTMDLSRMRKISFQVEMEATLGGAVKRGDVVDLVYVGVETNQETGGNFTYARIFMQDVVVWSAKTEEGEDYVPRSAIPDNEIGFAIVPGTNTSGASGGSDGKLSILTVVATGPQAEEIAVRAARGQIQILGRFSGADSASTTGYTMNRFTDIFSGTTHPESR